MYRVLFIDNDFIIRLGVHHILMEHLPTGVFFQTVSDHSEGQAWLTKNPCNLVIIGTVKTELYRLVNKIKAQDPRVKVLIFADMSYADAMDILVTGVDGFLYQRTEIDEIVLAIQTVLSGTAYWGKQLTEEMAEETLLGHIERKNFISQNSNNITRHKLLSSRQMDIIQALIRGESVPVIAANLGVSPSTVATHKSIAFKKLGVDSIVKLMDRYYADGNYLGSPDM